MRVDFLSHFINQNTNQRIATLGSTTIQEYNKAEDNNFFLPCRFTGIKEYTNGWYNSCQDMDRCHDRRIHVVAAAVATAVAVVEIYST